MQCLYLGLTQGMFTETTLKTVLDKTKGAELLPDASAAASKPTVVGSKHVVLRMRVACSNSVHLSAILLTDVSTRFTLQVMDCLREPARKCYSGQSKSLQRTAEALSWLRV